jgi:phosphonate transport system permease protein
MRAARDCENSLYLILLTIILVFAMDSFFCWLRRKLIRGS